jgi:hypothetical protein
MSAQTPSPGARRIALVELAYQGVFKERAKNEKLRKHRLL